MNECFGSKQEIYLFIICEYIYVYANISTFSGEMNIQELTFGGRKKNCARSCSFVVVRTMTMMFEKKTEKNTTWWMKGSGLSVRMILLMGGEFELRLMISSAQPVYPFHLLSPPAITSCHIINETRSESWKQLISMLSQYMYIHIYESTYYYSHTLYI